MTAMDEETPRTQRGSGARDALAVGACLLVAAAMVWVITRDGGDQPEVAVVAEAPGTAPAAAPGAPPGAEAAPEAAPAAAPGPEAAAPEPPAADGAPRVDVLRVEAGGAAVVAGRARPGANVAVLAGDRPLAEVRADEAGRFVALFDAGASEEPRALSVEAAAEDGAKQRSEQVVVLVPTPGKAAEAPRPAETAAAAPEAPADDKAGSAAPGVAAALLSPDSAEVAPPAPRPGARPGQVTLGAISYGETGAATLQGFGAPGAALRVYLDEAARGEGRVGPDGRWRLDLPEAAPGTYRLRVDQIDAAGRVTSRTEIPFRRETGGGAPARPGEVDVVVQPGNSLWTLARIHYGSGIRYTQILDANAASIADPDLIYPGQVFRVPEGAE